MGERRESHPITVITGPTASGKTSLACHLAHSTNDEIIGADSRQVYQFMDIGTGKDLDEFVVNGDSVPYHLIDYIHPSQKYHIQNYKDDFLKTWRSLQSKSKSGIICGGTGLYIESVCHSDVFTQIPINPDLRLELETLEKELLQSKLKDHTLKYQVDFHSKKRLIRGIEIHEYLKNNPLPLNPFPKFDPLYLICFSEIEERKRKITSRLKDRLQFGMIEEVEDLLKMGITHEKLDYFGLEYRFIGKYLKQEITNTELFNTLNTAIHQYAKRQMTWMRRIDKKHENVHFIDVTEKKSTDFLQFAQDKHLQHANHKR